MEFSNGWFARRRRPTVVELCGNPIPRRLPMVPAKGRKHGEECATLLNIGNSRKERDSVSNSIYEKFIVPGDDTGMNA